MFLDGVFSFVGMIYFEFLCKVFDFLCTDFIMEKKKKDYSLPDIAFWELHIRNCFAASPTHSIAADFDGGYEEDDDFYDETI